MKIVFMGTPGFAVPCLERILADGYPVAGVFTQPDKPAGRGYKLTPPPVKVLAEQHGIPVYQPGTLRDGEAADTLRELAPDLIVVVAYGKILPPAILALPPKGCVNVHASLLPRYRGAAPIQWSVVSGEKETGVTTMFMAEGLDTGDMILRAVTPIGADETAGALHDRLALLGADCLSRTLDLFAGGGPVPRVPQQEEQSSYAPLLKKEMGEMDFTQPAHRLHDLVRGLSPWPGAYTFAGERLLKVLSARVFPGEGRDLTQPGEVCTGTDGFVVQCGAGLLELLEVRPEGGKAMTGADYRRGHPVKVCGKKKA